MGRELRRKQAKKEGKPLTNFETKNTNEYNDIYKMLKTFGILLAIIIILYLFIAIVITKEIDWFRKDNDTNTTDTRVANSILAKNIFMQSEEEYYVYFYDFNKEEQEISNIVTKKLANSKVYRVDTSSALNTNYVGTESNKSAKTLEELKVVSPTVIKISGESIVEYYEADEIKNNLN